MNIPPAFRGRRPELLILDVDGVLTPNLIYLDGNGNEWKPFYVPDGVGLTMLREAGVRIAFLSGRPSEATHARAKSLRIDWHRTGVSEKGPATRALIDEAGTTPEATVYVGDDLIDLPAMREVGLPVAVADARPQVLEAAAAVTSADGGRGAVREVCEWILVARGDWNVELAAAGETRNEGEGAE